MRVPDAQTLAWTLAAGLERLEECGEAFPGRPDVARDVESMRDLFKGLIFALKLGTLDVEQFYTLIGAPGSGGVTSTSTPHPGRAPISPVASVSPVPDGPLAGETDALSSRDPGSVAGGGSG